jgi:hypothetical protein
MKIASFATAAAVAVLLAGAGARAETASAAAAKAAAQVHSAKSIECYRQADARELHHAERRKFYVECLKAK